MTTPVVAYIVEMTEYERGWGCRPDGYLAFPTDADATAYIAKETANRSIHSVPDEYVSYAKIGYRECSPRIITAMANNGGHGYVYVNRLNELKT